MIKKFKYLLILLFLLPLTTLNAQTFSFYRTSPEVIYTNDSFGVVSYGKLNNLTSSYNQIRIIRTVVSVPAGWETCICDIVQCHPPGMDTAIANYPPGLSDIAVMLYCHSIPGTGYVTFKAEKVSNTNENYSVTFGGAYNPIGIQQISSVAKEFRLNQNYPNPFNPNTVIRFQLPVNSLTTIKIFDVLSREVTTLVNEEVKPGTYEVEWDASNYPSGVYYYRIITVDASASFSTTSLSTGFTETKKMILIK